MGLVGTNYTEYAVQSAYVWDYGLLPSPVAGPPGTAAEILEPCAPTCLRMVAWVAQAMGQVPVPPDFETSANERLTNKAVCQPLVSDLPDGTQVITVAGVYYYALVQPPGDDDQLPAPAAPTDTSGVTYMSPAQFLQGVLGAVYASQQGPWGGRTAGDTLILSGIGGGGG